MTTEVGARVAAGDARCSCGNALVCVPCEYGRVRLPAPTRLGGCLFCKRRISDLNRHLCPALVGD